MKYPLTEEAKECARTLVQTWLDNPKNQLWDFRMERAYAGVVLERLHCVYDPSVRLDIHYRNLRELSVYGLIVFDTHQVLLLQELHNAVQNDFEVSEYFLTMNAVGMIVQGDVTMQPGSVLQNAVTNSGNIAQSVEQIADNLKSILGEEFLKAQTELRVAIHALRESTEANKQSSLGKVVSELGRCLQHGANTVVVVNALATLAPLLQGMV